MSFTESEVEEAALEWLDDLRYTILHGPEIAPGERGAEREAYQEVLLAGRLREALGRLNPKLPEEAIEDAFRRVTGLSAPSLIQGNRLFHRMLVDGVDVSYQAEGRVAYAKARLADFGDPRANDWVAVNQFTVMEGQHHRRPDIVLFLNGLPIGVIELKNPADEKATVLTAFKQIQTYKDEIGPLFTFNEVLVASDGNEARFGSLTADWEWFLPWRTIEGEEPAAAVMPELEVLIKGLFDRGRFLRYLRYFIVFEEDRSKALAKKIAGYHQFHAVEHAIGATVKASRPTGDRRCGVVWHTQGSGKSLTMAFYAGRIVVEPAMENPTVVVLTDRNDLDDQLFGTFSRCQELLRQKPVQADERTDLGELLKVASGGVVFTTVQKFLPEKKGETMPLLSPRRNIIVIADEAHRSHYDFMDGLAKHLRDALPNASFIGFTATPLELTDRSTRAVFGEYISIYDIQRAVADKATVPIYYEGRLAKLELDESERPKLDAEFEEITEGEEAPSKERLKTKWAALEAVVGSDKRVGTVVRDLLDHLDARQEAMDGKAMVVCMSRRICVEVYRAITVLRPAWHDDDDAKGQIKVVMTGSAAETEWQPHIRNKPRREKLADRFRDPHDPLKVVIVRDMWLTGFDVPCLHTMYVDKPMRGHGLMQAIARVNRVFCDKPGGLVVDYLGLADPLRKALANYTANGGKGTTALDQEAAVAIMLEKFDICCALFHGFGRSAWVAGTAAQRLGLLKPALEHVLAQEDGKTRLNKAVTELSQAFALSVPHEKALAIRNDVSFFQAVRATLVKPSADKAAAVEDMEAAIRQLVSRAISAGEVVDIFAAAGLGKPNLAILSDEFLAEIKGMPQKNLAVELLRRLIDDEIKTRARKNLVLSATFGERLERSIRAYQNRAIETAQVIEELIGLARDMREAGRRGEALNLTENEVAFYDALETNDSAVKMLGDEVLRAIARELVETVRKNVSIDWTVRESVRAKLRVMVKRVLKAHDYPPDKQDRAVQTVLAQAQLLCADWAEAGPAAAEEPSSAEAVLPAFRLVKPRAEEQFVSCIPLLTLQAAAGGFGGSQDVNMEGWVVPNTTHKLRKGLFVAQVVGRSMEPMIPDGAYCLFAAPVEGSRQGRIVLVQHHGIQDPETGGSYTVKRYASSRVASGEGQWRHAEIRLEPANPEFKPIVLKEVDEGEVVVIAEVVEVLR